MPNQKKLNKMTRADIVGKILTAIYFVLVYFAPTGSFILTVGFFVFADLITGVIAAHYRGEQIRSRKLARTVSKYLVYAIAILTAHVICKSFFPEFPGLQLMAGFIAYIEVKSIDENIKDITGYSFFKTILDKMKPKDTSGSDDKKAA